MGSSRYVHALRVGPGIGQYLPCQTGYQLVPGYQPSNGQRAARPQHRAYWVAFGNPQLLGLSLTSDVGSSKKRLLAAAAVKGD